LLKDSVKKALPKFNKRVKKTLRVEVPNIILKPLSREFDALNTMDIQSTTGESQLTFEEAKLQMQEIKRLTDLKAEKKKYEKKLKRVLTPEQRKTQEEELAAYEATRAKMIEEYNHCITFRDDHFPITKFRYRVNNFTKEATMRITRNNKPLNLMVYKKFILKKLGFYKWLELHA
ncbi:hypothetical protein Tco_1074773, partial [Tanacetum coccineum]